jgi:hypothetical protein
MTRSLACLLFLAIVLAAASFATPPRARFSEPVVFQSTGRLTYATGSKDRDRTITMLPVDKDGLVATLDTTIVDHVDDDFEYHGVLNVDEQGTVTTRQMEMVNAANILGVSPQVIKQLGAGQPEVQTEGHLEISGDVLPVHYTHKLIGAASDVPLRVVTTTKTPDGKIHLETEAAFGPDGLPLSAHTKGTIQALVSVTVDLTLTRKAYSSSRSGDALTAVGAR